MDGASELAQLAKLLRIGADTARRIAGVRPVDAGTIERLARQAEDMAIELDAMAFGRRATGHPRTVN